MVRLGRPFSWWQRAALPWRKWQVVLQVEAGDDVPEDLPPRTAALVAPGGQPTWVVFDCPCGAGHRIMLNLNPARRPWWVLRSRVPLTIAPSIDDVGHRRRCHFFVRNGKVRWARWNEKAKRS